MSNLDENPKRMGKEDKEQVEIWSAFRAGDEKAFSKLFFLYYEILYHYGIRITFEPVQVKDLLQDFFLELYESRAGLSPEVNNIKAYLLTAFRRKLMRASKKRRRQNHQLEEFVDEEQLPFEIGIEAVLIQRESVDLNKQLVSQLLSELPPRQREIIYLKYYLDLSLPEIASSLQISYQVVANHLYRALKKLQSSSTIKKFFKLDIWLLVALYPLLTF